MNDSELTPISRDQVGAFVMMKADLDTIPTNYDPKIGKIDAAQLRSPLNGAADDLADEWLGDAELGGEVDLAGAGRVLGADGADVVVGEAGGRVPGSDQPARVLVRPVPVAGDEAIALLGVG